MFGVQLQSLAIIGAAIAALLVTGALWFYVAGQRDAQSDARNAAIENIIDRSEINEQVRSLSDCDALRELYPNGMPIAGCP